MVQNSPITMGRFDWPQVRLYRQVLGCIVAGDTSFQKAFCITGPTRSGKGVTAEYFRKAVAGGHGALTVGDFGKNFGMQGVLYKRLIMITDARNSQWSDLDLAGERLAEHHRRRCH